MSETARGLAPTLETDRLVLSPHRAEDFGDCARLWSDPAVTRFIGGRPFSPEETWARMLRYAGLWTMLGYGYWALRDKSSGRFIGDVGFADYKRAIEPSLGSVPEMGWVLAPLGHGQGFATEAVAAALRWSDAHLKSDRTVCIIVPAHARSIRVAERVGYRATGEGRYGDHAMTIFSRPASCWSGDAISSLDEPGASVETFGFPRGAPTGG